MRQQTTEWYQARIGKLTASRIPAILGLSPYNTEDDVLREMVREYFGYEREFTGNAATEWGNEYEQVALDDLEKQANLFIAGSGLVNHPDHKFIAASPDGLTVESVVEVKCPFNKKVFELKNRPDYFMQMQVQMACTVKAKGIFFVWTPKQSSIEYIDYDESHLKDALPALKAFYERYLEAIKTEDKNPHLEPLEVSRDDNDWLESEKEYALALAQMEQAKSKADAAKEKLLTLSQGKKCRGKQFLAYTSTRDGSISYAKAIKDLLPDADLSNYRGKPKSVFTVRAL